MYARKYTLPKLAAIGLIIAAIAIAGTVALVLHITKATHSPQQTTNSTAIPKASPAQLAADEAAYKASAALMAQLCSASDQAKQAEQTAQDQYGDASPQYQAAKAAADKAEEACSAQTQDAANKSLQVTIDGGSTND